MNARSRLIVALDVPTRQEALALVQELRGVVTMFKVGLELIVGGGVPEGDSLLLAGPSGSGKSLLGTKFIAEGLRQGEPGIVAIFEELPAEYAQRAATFGIDDLDRVSERAALAGAEFVELGLTRHIAPG